MSNYWNFIPLEKRHRRKEFDCGNNELNQYLKRYARQNDKKSINKAFVAVQPDTPLVIDGEGLREPASPLGAPSTITSTERHLPKTRTKGFLLNEGLART